MTEDNWGTAAFIHSEEIGKWKIVDHAHNNKQAVRSCGELVQFDGDYEARNFVRVRAAKALVAYFLEREGETLARPNPQSQKA